METKKVPDTPWHIGFIKKDESDPRRHKAINKCLLIKKKMSSEYLLWCVRNAVL